MIQSAFLKKTLNIKFLKKFLLHPDGEEFDLEIILRLRKKDKIIV